MKNKVSIGMPVFNGEKYIKQAIKSLLDQSYKNIELIISDNCSIDNTSNICRYYAKRDKRIIYIRHNKNIGLADNFNFVLKQSKGELFMWAAHDDIWEKNYASELVKLLNVNKKAVLAISNYKYFNNTLSQIRSIKVPQKPFNKTGSILFFLDNKDFFFGAFFYGIYRSRILKEIGGLYKDFRPVYDGSSDTLTVYKILLRGIFLKSDKILFRKRDTGFVLDTYKTIYYKGFSIKIIIRLLRYFFHPFAVIMDLSISVIELIRAKQFSFKDKLIIYIFLTKHYILSLSNFIISLLEGLRYLTINFINFKNNNNRYIKRNH